MTRWHLRRRADDRFSASDHNIDATEIRRESMAKTTEQEIRSQPLSVDGRDVPLDELFELSIDPSVADQMIVEGDLQNVHGLGSLHDRGEFRIQGNAGNGVGLGMTGGTLVVEGDAGEFVGAPFGTHKIGMAGGLIKVSGHVGAYAGHRMRRGTLVVQGSAGPMLAASMVAGTICVGGGVGDHLAVGMKRGSVLLAQTPQRFRRSGQTVADKSAQYSRAMPFDAHFLSLYDDPAIEDLIRPLRRNASVVRVRADRSVEGLGEILFPVASE